MATSVQERPARGRAGGPPHRRSKAARAGAALARSGCTSLWCPDHRLRPWSSSIYLRASSSPRPATAPAAAAGDAGLRAADGGVVRWAGRCGRVGTGSDARALRHEARGAHHRGRERSSTRTATRSAPRTGVVRAGGAAWMRQRRSGDARSCWSSGQARGRRRQAACVVPAFRKAERARLRLGLRQGAARGAADPHAARRAVQDPVGLDDPHAADRRSDLRQQVHLRRARCRSPTWCPFVIVREPEARRRHRLQQPGRPGRTSSSGWWACPATCSASRTRRYTSTATWSPDGWSSPRSESGRATTARPGGWSAWTCGPSGWARGSTRSSTPGRRARISRRATSWFRPDSVFVMGDNRDNSADSRFGLGGGGNDPKVVFVPYGHIKGKAMIIWLSLSHGGLLSAALRGHRPPGGTLLPPGAIARSPGPSGCPAGHGH